MLSITFLDKLDGADQEAFRVPDRLRYLLRFKQLFGCQEEWTATVLVPHLGGPLELRDRWSHNHRLLIALLPHSVHRRVHHGKVGVGEEVKTCSKVELVFIDYELILEEHRNNNP